MERKSFLDQEAPAGYIAGLGRGATGFTTAADIGSARIRPGIVVASGEEEDEDNRNLDEDDESGLLLNGEFNKEDEEADKVFEEIDNRMKMRNKKKRKMQDDIQKENVNEISEQFVDLKRALVNVSKDEWANLPEVGDLTRRNKRTRLFEQSQQRFYAVPDTLLASVTSGANADNSIDLKNEETDFKSISLARDRLLSLKLDNLADEQTIGPDRGELLLELNKSEAEQVGDVNKARMILSSLRKSDPLKADGWIASARLEEQAKKFEKAKSIIQEGCSLIKFNETLWLESIRLHQSNLQHCKILAREAIQYNPRSETLWLRACELENDKASQKKIIRKAIEQIPNNASLWRKMIDLEDEEEDVKKIIVKALELCPTEVDLWLTLVNLQTIEDGKKTLNKARKAIPDSAEIWIMAAKLEEKSDVPSSKIFKILEKGIKEVLANGNNSSRYDWFQKAALAEREGFMVTCRGIVPNVINIGLEHLSEEAQLDILLEDANTLARNREFEVAYCVYEQAIIKFPHDLEAWLKLINILKSFKLDVLQRLYSFCEKAVQSNPTYEVLWLIYAKEKWINGDIKGAQSILQRAFEKLPTNDNIWLALIKVEYSEKHFEKVQTLFEEAKAATRSVRIWHKFVTFKRQMGDNEAALHAADEGLNIFPDFAKLYLQKAQILEHMGDIKAARESLSMGSKICPKSVPLWLSLSRLDEIKFKIAIRARSVLDTALIHNPDSDEIWIEKIRLEKRQNNLQQARALAAKAVKLLKESGGIWFEHLSLIEKKSHRKNAFVDALKSTKNSSSILLAFGYFFWVEGKFTSCKMWFERAVEADKDNGDNWAWLYTFMSKFGVNDEIERLLEEFKAADPHHGEIWCSISKRIENLDKSNVDILKLVADEIAK